MSDLATAAAGSPGAGSDGNGSESQTSEATQAAGDGTVGGSSEQPQAPAWAAQLPDDLKGSEKLTQFAKLADLGRAFIDADGKLANAVVKPGEGATEDEVKTYRQKMGVPDSPKDYALKDLKDIPDIGMDVNIDDSRDWFEQSAHEHGLNKDQAEAFFRTFLQRVGDQVKAGKDQRNTAADSARKVLQTEMGDRYDAFMARSRNLVNQVGGKEFSGFLEETGLSNDPRMIRFMGKMAQMIGDDALPDGQSAGKQPFNTKTDDGIPNMGYTADDFK